MNKTNSTVTKILALLLAFGLSGPALAQELPGEIKSALMLKLLGFDRKLKERSPEGVRIGLIGASASSGDIDAVLKLDGKKVQGQTITVVPLLDVSAAELPGRLDSGKVNAVYVLSGSATGLVQAIIKQAAQNGIATFGGSKKLVLQGLAVGFDVEDGKPRFFVNRETTKSHGLEFPSRVLRLARLID